MKKHIVITGPESSGKSVFAGHLSTVLEATLVNEYAREYLEERDGEYERSDLRKIAIGQFQNQLAAQNGDNDFIVSDTCLMTIKIWDEWKYRQSDDFVLEWYGLQMVDLYVLCKPDLPWEYDVLRESEHDREALFEVYRKEIESIGVPYFVLEGAGESRMDAGVSDVKRYFVVGS